MSEAAKEVPFDSAKAEAFAGSLLPHLNHGAWCLMASIGHRTGLFDTMRDLPASTVQDIARAANLKRKSEMWFQRLDVEHRLVHGEDENTPPALWRALSGALRERIGRKRRERGAGNRSGDKCTT